MTTTTTTRGLLAECERLSQHGAKTIYTSCGLPSWRRELASVCERTRIALGLCVPQRDRVCSHYM